MADEIVVVSHGAIRGVIDLSLMPSATELTHRIAELESISADMAKTMR